jgi:hypothetical protein
MSNQDPAGILRDPERLAALHALDLLDTPAEEGFDRLARLASKLLSVPVALVSLLDTNRQFFKSCLGLPEPWHSWRETPLSHSFCQHVVAEAAPLIISDARQDPFLRDSPAIVDLGVIAYLGIPLISHEGQAIGSFCVIDHAPRVWTANDIDIVRDLAASVMAEIQARNALRYRRRVEELQYFEALIENALDIVTIIDADGTIRYQSPAVERVLGHPPRALVGKNAFDFVHPDDRPQVMTLFKQGIAIPGFMGIVECRYRHREDSWRLLEGIGKNLLHDPMIRGVVFTFRDITERKQAEEALRASDRLAALGRLAAGIGHELRNPLTVLAGRVQLLAIQTGKGELPSLDVLARHVTSLSDAAERMKRILEGLSTYAKPPKPEPRRLSAAELLAATAELVAYESRKRRIQVSVEAAPSLPAVLGDRSQLMQVLVNLATNAIEAMGPEGQLVLRAGLEGAGPGDGMVRIEVADTGPGIAPETLARIWDAFYTTKAEGTGLGLSIVRGLVGEQPGAAITVESHVDRGTTFTISMPAAPLPGP